MQKSSRSAWQQWSRRIIFASVLAVGLSSSVWASNQTERILAFDSHITVNEDSTLLVTETIKVVSQGQQIRHGIYRDFPTRYIDQLGNNVVVGFDIINIERDGQSESYHLENLSNGKRVYIGKSDQYVANGTHIYMLTYKTTRQLGFFKDHDELYWNVTGNGWNFPISNVMATVELPKDAASKITETNAFTGYQGARGERSSNFEILKDFYGNPQFITTLALEPNQGLTIFLSWPKGYVQPPSAMTKFGYFLADNRGVIFVVLCFLAILFYYLFTWSMVGRDPKKGTIIPLFYPPQEFSPAEIRYLWKMGYDQKALSVAVVNLAVKGYIKIEEIIPLGSLNLLNLGRTYTLTRCKTIKQEASPEEKLVFNALLGSSRDTLELNNANYTKIAKAIDDLKAALSRKVEKVYFLTNQGYFLFGAILSAGIGYLTFIFTASSELSLLFAVIVGILTIGVNFVFYRILKAPTLQGRKVMDQLEGFRQYLSVTEKDRMNMLNPPEKTPALFEKYLPYALALDVEQKWSEQFNDVLAKAADGKEYSPIWYSGSDWSYRNPSRFSSSLGGAFTTTIASAAHPPGSSSGGGFSGGGGGGSSGGGGGGGGGGGW